MFKAMSALFVVGVLSVSMAIGQQETPPAAPPTDGAKASAPAPMPAASGEKEPCCGDSKSAKTIEFPCSCPLYPVFPLGGGNYVYYASRYETSCDDTPTAAYVYGGYAYPLTCITGECPKSYRDEKFPGLARKLPADYVHAMPSLGTAPIYARRLVDPDLVYVYFADQDGNTRWAKVFTYLIDVRGAYLKRPDADPEVAKRLESRVIYFALEIEEPAEPQEGTHGIGSPTPLGEDSEPTGDQTYVYRYLHPTTSGKPIPLIIFCAR